MPFDNNLESANINDLERLKFTSDNGRVSINVKPSSGLLAGISYDSVSVSYPSADVEVYTYLSGLVAQATVTVTYTDSTKEFVSSVVKA